MTQPPAPRAFSHLPLASRGLGRRDFLRAAAGGCALLLAGRADAAAALLRPRSDTLYVGLVLPPDAAVSPGFRGAMLGAEEAARTGALVGRSLELRTAERPGDVERLLREEGVTALVAGFGGALPAGLADEAPGVPVMNVGAREDALRGADCRPALFHVEASEAMYAAALAARRGEAADAATAALWHPSLERYGAAQLNDRFRARWGGEMDGAEWAGWMAVKALWEASLRARSTEPAALTEYLTREGTQLDGHKGWPLGFRRADRQLRQPLYLLSGDGTRVLGEVPARGGEDGPSSRELLDRLAANASPTPCTANPEGAR